ncbi:hypothetical protein ASPACDRAFT_47025 [Aspergillus aculeatus ATCC 16872]|uniref:Uncharacterized protein n=1 Tax=Aspergillus aculeatus (strain ATCC 16872 / CBS 172.66 / WB 5094) TaxID=690307 RepID=A0A1L9WJC5_ASPA1|nr:uncharacterized protein ASPACDRAFT_47025 [Aspergillus aculeatus ATCC 16872]OJJ96255.1 hypothetical protein ASPACDRAFT_47025 [Aspergillus aculeatus ATCC 16872]
MSPTTEGLVDQAKPQPDPIKVHLFGEGEHTHGEPRPASVTKIELYRFAAGQKKVYFFLDDHHLVQFWRPEDLPPTAPPLAPGHYRLRFQCACAETTVDWPEEQADAYHDKFVRRLGYYQNDENDGWIYYHLAPIEEVPLSWYFGDLLRGYTVR